MDGQRFIFLETGLWKDFIFNCNVYLGCAPKSSLGTESQYGWSAQTKGLLNFWNSFRFLWVAKCSGISKCWV